MFGVRSNKSANGIWNGFIAKPLEFLTCSGDVVDAVWKM